MPLYPRFSRDLPWLPPIYLKDHPRIVAFLDDVVSLFLVAFPHRRLLARSADDMALLRDVSSGLYAQCLSS